VDSPEDAASLIENSTSAHDSHLQRRQTGNFWMESIAHGQVSYVLQADCPVFLLELIFSLLQMPFAPPGYQVFRNVKDFGAVGDGVTDDT
jgi:hypothetical protein